MSTYIKKFQTHNDYMTSSLVYPNVSLCMDNTNEDFIDVHYNPIHNYAEEYLTFVALEDGIFTFSPQNNNVISYSIDNGETWTTGNGINVSAGDEVLWKGEMIPNNMGIGNFTSTAEFNVKGNIMSLLYGDNYKGQTSLTNYDSEFYNLFDRNTKLINAKNLSLPATTLTDSCYSNMFYSCTALTTAPELPATTLASNCYSNMFEGCRSLMTAPELPATTLAYGCYEYMFYSCTSLITTSELPATTLASYCYGNMFQGCTSLVSAPELPATTLASSCYQYMFYDCTVLATAPELPATTLAIGCYYGMFNGCTALVTAPELPATTLATSCYRYMFNCCTALVTAPELPATTLTEYCYQSMFQGCTSLVSAPELPATTLVNNCYKNMFDACTLLNYIKAMFTTTPSSTYTGHWVRGVASTGTFVKNSAATWTTTGNNGVPSGWTVQTTSA